MKIFIRKISFVIYVEKTIFGFFPIDVDACMHACMLGGVIDIGTKISFCSEFNSEQLTLLRNFKICYKSRKIYFKIILNSDWLFLGFFAVFKKKYFMKNSKLCKTLQALIWDMTKFWNFFFGSKKVNHQFYSATRSILWELQNFPKN